METNRKAERRNVTNTITAGLKSLQGGGSRFYVIEFKTPTQSIPSNKTQEVIIDYIEIGRAKNCQIRFGEDCRTVSGVHCSITREGKDYYIRHLSKTNPTLVNGKPIADKWYLNSGDEIRLSYDGPLLGFIVPQNNLSSSLPLTRRMDLFRKQALRPFRTAIAVLSVLLFSSVLAGAWYLNELNKENMSLRLRDREEKVLLQTQIDSLRMINSKNEKLINTLQRNVKDVGRRSERRMPSISPTLAAPGSEDLKQLYGSTYFIYAKEVVIKGGGETKTREGDWTGTGFLLSDGSFVTARHVIEPWMFVRKMDDEDPLSIENLVASNGGEVTAEFVAVSSTGESFTFKSTSFKVDRSSDETKQIEVDEDKLMVTRASMQSDWATMKVSGNGTIVADRQLANSIPVGSKLFTLGFPFGLGITDKSISPIYSDFTVATSGLMNGFINISGRSFDKGNSGGPVFIKTNDGYVAVGIISAGMGTQGMIIPISKIL
jgi:S1-C subfamily serine protease